MLMNFLDPLFDKIPIIKDMNKKRRLLWASFVLFVFIVVIASIIDAIADQGGVITLVGFIVGFIIIAVIILMDFISSGKSNDNSQVNNKSPDDSGGEGFNFSEVTDYTDNYDRNVSYQQNGDYGGETQDFQDDGGYGDSGYDNIEYTQNDAPQYSFSQPETSISYEQPTGDGYSDIEYTVAQEEDSTVRRFGGVFKRNRENGSIISGDINSAAGNNYDRGEYFSDAGESSSFADNEAAVDAVSRSAFQQFRASRSFDRQDEEPAAESAGDDVGTPVMAFKTSSDANSNESGAGAVGNAGYPLNDYQANNYSNPMSSKVVGGPVMSIPLRNEHAVPPVQPYGAYPDNSSARQEQPAVNNYAPTQSNNAVVRDSNGLIRGQELDSFFDNMDDEELHYSDCVEVWASDAKPSMMKLLKLIESMSDKKKADALGREAEYVNAMMDRIYYFTMLDSVEDNLDLKKYNFSQLVKECLRRFSPFFMEKRIGLLWKGLDIDIVTDKRWLIFALTQVIFNAVEFTGLGGKIAISAKKEGSMVHLMVDDNGCGISAEDLPQIFMAGFMGDNVQNENGRRTGMGLFITRSVVEKLGGSVTVDSSPGSGTRITMILPEKP